MRKALKRLGLAGLVVALVVAAPIARNELACMSARETPAAPYRPILPPEQRRNAVDTLLTYPEWSVVHAYEDFAGVLASGAESDFSYAAHVVGYWANLCALSRLASRDGEIALDMRAMLYIVGVSFSAEMAVKGLYENTVGRIAEWLRGPERTAEDRLALAEAKAYALFLRQTPWFDYPFGRSLARLWAQPLGEGSWARSLERRFALTLEYGVKAVYARAIALLATAAPAKLTIDTLVTGIDRDRLAADPAVTMRGELAGALHVETPRYRAYTQFLERLAAAGGQIREIAGNDRLFVTIIAARPPAGPNLAPLVVAPIQSMPGRTRYGIVLPVADLTAFIRRIEADGGVFEHAYDY